MLLSCTAGTLRADFHNSTNSVALPCPTKTYERRLLTYCCCARVKTLRHCAGAPCRRSRRRPCKNLCCTTRARQDSLSGAFMPAPALYWCAAILPLPLDFSYSAGLMHLLLQTGRVQTTSITGTLTQIYKGEGVVGLFRQANPLAGRGSDCMLYCKRAGGFSSTCISFMAHSRHNHLPCPCCGHKWPSRTPLGSENQLYIAFTCTLPS